MVVTQFTDTPSEYTTASHLPYSPDLDPIEKGWTWIKDYIGRHHHHHHHYHVSPIVVTYALQVTWHGVCIGVCMDITDGPSV